MVNKYNLGEHYGWHFDQTYMPDQQGNLARMDYSYTIFLNDDYEGGEFVLCGEPLEKKKGSAVDFPSNFMFPHEVKEVTSGDRYSVMTWIL